VTAGDPEAAATSCLDDAPRAPQVDGMDSRRVVGMAIGLLDLEEEARGDPGLESVLDDDQIPHNASVVVVVVVADTHRVADRRQEEADRDAVPGGDAADGDDCRHFCLLVAPRRVVTLMIVATAF